LEDFAVGGDDQMIFQGLADCLISSSGLDGESGSGAGINVDVEVHGQGSGIEGGA
jgi:hypothetical protein